MAGSFRPARTIPLRSAYSYGFFKSRSKGKPSVAMPAGDQTVLDNAVSLLMRGNEGRHGLQLLSDNLDAFAARALSARNAGRSLDLMYYMWKGDLTGRLLAHEVIAAADEKGIAMVFTGTRVFRH